MSICHQGENGGEIAGCLHTELFLHYAHLTDQAGYTSGSYRLHNERIAQYLLNHNLVFLWEFPVKLTTQRKQRYRQTFIEIHM